MDERYEFFFFFPSSFQHVERQPSQTGEKKKKNEVMNVTSSLECLEMASGNLEVTPKESGRVSYV